MMFVVLSASAAIFALFAALQQFRHPRTALAARRIAGVTISVLAVHLISHWVIRATPGGPFDAETKLDPLVKKRLAERVQDGDDSVWRTLDLLMSEDGLPSLALRDYSAGEILIEGGRRSLALGLRALVAAILVGMVVGSAAAILGGASDRVAVSLTSLIPAIPVFAWAAILIGVFSVGLGLLPPASIDGRPPHLPTAAAALAPAAVIARLTRDELRRVRSSTFVRAAAARGASRFRRLLVHELPAGLIPVVAYVGPAAASLLTGTLAVEAIFGIPGLGTHLVQAALSRDYPVVGGAATIYAAALGCFGIASEIAASRLDPRLTPE